ncbi:MAG: hypothetical protein GYB32_14100, partial [Algicola sp.]|nr:hypothetical protein [Algicola sp.]
NGSKHEMENHVEGDYIFTVTGVSDSLYNITFMFARFKMSSSSNQLGTIISIDTDKQVTDEDIEAKLFSQLITVDLQMEMYRSGKIKSIEGADRMIDKMAGAAGDFDEFTKELIRESMRSEFSNESLAKSFEQMTFIYPTESIKKGESWTNTFEGELSSQNTWTLDEMTKNDILISGKSTIKFVNADADLEMNLTGDMTSNVVTSTDHGFVKSMSSTSVAKGHSIMHNMNDLKVPTSITSNITYKIEKHVQ